MALTSSPPRVCRHSTPAASSTLPTTALLLSATKNMKKKGVAVFLFACLQRGRDFVWRKNKWKKKIMLPVMTVLVRRQLGWGPDVALGQVGRMFGQFLIFQGCSAFQQILICRRPCASQFPIIVSSSSLAQMLTRKFLNSRLSLRFLTTRLLTAVAYCICIPQNQMPQKYLVVER